MQNGRDGRVSTRAIYAPVATIRETYRALGTKHGLNLLVEDLVPVKTVEKRMALEIFGVRAAAAKSLLDVALNEASEKGHGSRRNVRGKGELGAQDPLIHGVDLGMAKRTRAAIFHRRAEEKLGRYWSSSKKVRFPSRMAVIPRSSVAVVR